MSDKTIDNDLDKLSKNELYLHRLFIIDECLSNTAKPKTFEEISQKLQEAGCAMSARNFENIRKTITRIYHLDIVSEKSKTSKKHVYYYEQPNESIFKHELNKTDFEKIANILERLSAFENLSPNEVQEITRSLGITNKIPISSHKIIEYERNYDYQNTKNFKQHFNLLFNAIKNKDIVCIRYKTYNDKEEVVTFHPYYLKQYNSRWFCIGHSENRDRDIDIRPVDSRILEIYLAKDKVAKGDKLQNFQTKYNRKNWEKEYFSDIIGITKLEKDKTTIVLQVSDLTTLKQLASKPIHKSFLVWQQINGSKKQLTHEQVVELKDICLDTPLLITLEVIENYELERFIISYMDTLTVLEPKELKQKIKSRLNQALKNYS